MINILARHFKESYEAVQSFLFYEQVWLAVISVQLIFSGNKFLRMKHVHLACIITISVSHFIVLLYLLYRTIMCFCSLTDNRRLCIKVLHLSDVSNL